MTLFIYLILFFLVYKIVKFLVGKFNIGSESKRKPIIVISTILITPLVIVAIYIIFIIVMSYYPQESFTKKGWIENSNKRYAMSKDIINSEMLIGLNLNEVTTLLGTDYYEQDGHINYLIGFVPGLLAFNPDILVLQMNDNIVSSVTQETTRDF